MIGQEFSDVTRVVVLLETTDGQQIGWALTNLEAASWVHAGLRNGSSYATVTITGEFQRMAKRLQRAGDPPPRIISGGNRSLQEGTS